MNARSHAACSPDVVDGLPTLSVQTTYFSPRDRQSAETLGFELYELMTRSRKDRLAFGPGIPVRIAVHPEDIDFDVARHVVVIPVLGQTPLLNQAARNDSLATLRTWHQKLTDRGCSLPVLMSEGWREFSGRISGRPVRQYDYDDEGMGFPRTSLDIVLSICRLLRDDEFHVFVSYATGVPGSTQVAARTIREFAKKTAVDAVVYDTTDFESRTIKEKLKAADGHGVFLVVRSDDYGSRHWCQRELLWAKEARLPTLTVEVLRNGEPRSYPYSGNGPTIVWSEREGEMDASALRVVLRAVVECLRAQHFLRESDRLKAELPDLVTLARPPELLDLAQGPVLATRSPLVLHPDPELSFAEREVLRLARPRLQLVTPTTLYRAIDVSRKDGPPRPAGLQGVRVALSVSEVIDDARVRKGVRQEHVQDALVHITRAMVSAGAAIAYGGDLRAGGYDELFLDLIRAYNEAGVRESELLHGYLPATFDQSTRPKGRAFNIEAVEDSPRRKLPSPVRPLSPARSALYLSEMRSVMAVECDARVLLAGQALPRKDGGDVGYTGPYPGVVEEAWHTLHPGDGEPRALYVVGGFGGAAALVAALASDDQATPALQTSNFSGAEYSKYRSVVVEFEGDGDRSSIGVPATSETLEKDLRRTFEALLETDDSSMAWNGLTVAKNRELFWTQDIVRSTALILEGLLNVRARRLKDSLEIELVSGNVLRTERANAIVLPVFDDVPITGAGAALDRATGGAVSAARAQGQQVVALTSPQVDANWLVLANLGPFKDRDGLPAVIQERAAHVSGLARRHDFGRISVVTFAGTVLGNVEEIAARMLAGFESLPDKTQLQWFEAHPDRFERLKTYLKTRDGVVLSQKVLPELDPDLVPRAKEDLLAIVRREDHRLRCTLLLPAGAAVSHEQTNSLTDEQLESLNRASSNETPSLETIEDIGQNVAHVLFGEEGAKQLAEHCPGRRLVIQHDVESTAIPFEALRVGPVTPGLKDGLVRRLSLQVARLSTPGKRPPTTGKLRIVLVVNPTCDLPHAEKEAEEVRRQLGDAEQVDIRPALIRANATKEAVLGALTDPTVDVFHYCGHAAFERPGEDGSGIVCADGALTVQDLQDNQIGPRIVFFNACQSARVRKGEVPTQVVARAFAEAVLRGGVEAYVGTFWPVADDAAALFATRVYLGLARGAELHEAVTTARRALFDAREPDWANYLLFGTGAFTLKTR